MICSGAFPTTSTDHGQTWAPLAPWRYGGVTSWKEGNLQVGLPWDYTYDNEERTALRGDLVAIDASGKNVERGDPSVDVCTNSVYTTCCEKRHSFS